MKVCGNCKFFARIIYDEDRDPDTPYLWFTSGLQHGREATLEVAKRTALEWVVKEQES